jgi:tRNA (guanine26-N2/guanine27-N2)-dimethyltransferase
VVKTEMRFEDAHRLLARYWLEDARFDLVDVDGFGSVNFAEGALRVVRYGGYYYATSTDGRALCGQNPSGAGASFGNVVVAPSRPSVNETALRAFVGDVVRRAAVLKLDVVPVFSLFHPHGPVFRVMFRVDKATNKSGNGGNGTASYDAFAAADDEGVARMGFVGYCDSCGSTEVIRRPLVDVFGHDKPHRRKKGDGGGDGASGKSESRLTCSVCGAREESLAVSGPIWIGPLHDAETVEAMWTQADAMGWLDDDDDDDDTENPPRRRRREKGQLSLRDLLDAFRGEANPRLSGVAHYYRTDELGRKGRCTRVPPRDVLITALRAEGHAATRSHIDPRGVKTNAALNVVVDVANRAVAALDELDGR